MLDFIKLRTYNQTIINRLFGYDDFVTGTPITNGYFSKYHKELKKRITLDFKKSNEKGKYIFLDISISPHYHFNQYRHNGNDLTAENSAKSVFDILTLLNIEKAEFSQLEIVNLEYGVNIVPHQRVENVVNGFYYANRTPFVVPDPTQKPYFRVTEIKHSRNVEIKVYAKGLQFENFPECGIDRNTLRFEVRNKKSKRIKELGINTANDLINPEKLKNLPQDLIDKLDSVLYIEQTTKLDGLKQKEIDYLNEVAKVDFWSKTIAGKTRNIFLYHKKKYNEIVSKNGREKTQIKGLIIDKLIEIYSAKTPKKKRQKFEEKENKKNSANSPKNIIKNQLVTEIKKNASNTINCESALKTLCKVTNLDISMQKKNSVNLSVSGLEFYYKNHPEIYSEIERKYLTLDKSRTDLKDKFYNIAHNIRNSKSNIFHNRRKFENRNYHPEQLQLNFN